MRPASRPIAALLILQLLVVASMVSAGPVPADDVQGHAERAEAVHSTLRGLSAGALGEGLALGGAARTAVPPASAGGDSGPSSSALAAEIIKESEAGAAAAEPTRNTQGAGARSMTAAAASGASPRGQAQAAEGDQELRAMGKAAVRWLKESVPWLRNEADEGGADKPVVLRDSADWATSGLEGGKAGRSALPGPMHVPDATGRVQSGPGYNVGYGNNAAPQTTVLDPEQNLVRVVANLIREVLEHPMTWLVAALVVVGAIAMKKADRRPK